MTAPRHLVVVGAAAGMGRWLCRHLFATMEWASVTVVDTEQSADALAAQDWEFARPPERCVLADAPAALDRDSVALCIAVPRTEVAAVAEVLMPAARPDAVVFDTSSAKKEALSAIRHHGQGQTVFGTHPLFGPSIRTLDGQTIVVTPDPDRPEGHAWLADAVVHAGGIVRYAAAEEHDAVMAYIETMAQQTLLSFVDAVIESGFDLEDQLWPSRTPLFEALLGLATNVLAETQLPHVRSRQLADDAARVRTELAAATERGRAVDDVDAYIAALRDHFSGALFETVQGTAAAALSATQAKRAELSRLRRTGRLVGIRPVERPDTLRVGTIADLSPTSVTLDEVLVGEPGAAALLTGPGLDNAARLGLGGKPQPVKFRLGRIDVVAGAELDHALDDWLAHVRRDVRFLVPESVAGAGVRSVVAEIPRVRNCEVVSEVVRTGQRAVVIRLEVRCDQDVADTIELLRERVAVAYAWPEGLTLPADDHTGRPVHYLGPAGTFSEAAALQCIAGLHLAGSRPAPLESFDAVVAAAADGEIGVIPVVSSASGLVERTAAALIDAPAEVSAGGVVDVTVRFDAIVPVGAHLEGLRGSRVLSHPQALEQCSRFVTRWGLEPTPSPSTAEACRIVADEGDAVAIVRAGLDLPDGVHVAEREIDDIAGAITRFLVIGQDGTFGELRGGSDPTLRSLWIAPDRAALAAVIDDAGPAFDEIITSPNGQVLLVTSRDGVAGDADRVRFLGRIPWTPRTPLVRLGGLLPVNRG